MLEARTLDEKITLQGLRCYQNYSIQVVAATKVGDGLKSRSVYCRTKEDCEYDQGDQMELMKMPPKSP